VSDDPPAASASAARTRPPHERGLALLAAGVPLSLLLDLVLPLDSAALLRDEPGDVSWLRSATG
jgi:hypothetical protein